MKRMSYLVPALGLVLAIGAPAFASQCPTMIKRANDKMASMDPNSEQVKKAKALVEEADKAHKAGKHAESEQKADQALALLK